jgi:hypothetical protein
MCRLVEIVISLSRKIVKMGINQYCNMESNILQVYYRYILNIHPGIYEAHQSFNREKKRCKMSVLYSKKYDIPKTVSVVSWSEFLTTDPEARVRFSALPEKKQWV